MAALRPRRNKDGSVVWQVQIRQKNYPPVSKTFASKADAEDWLFGIHRAMRRGTYEPEIPAASQPTVGDMVDRFISDVLPYREKQRRNLEGVLLEWKAAIGSMVLAELRPSDIAKVRDKMLGTKTCRDKLPANATVLRKMAVLATALKVARNDWGWIETSPITNVTKPRAASGRTRYLSEDERQRLLNACKQSTLDLLYPFVLVAICTGMRLSEISSMRWETTELTGEIGRVPLAHTKNGSARSVALTDPALSEIRRMADERKKAQLPLEGYVFASRILEGAKPVDIRTPWERAVKNAGLKDFRFHDLRHSAASHLAMNGATPSEMAEVLGHKTLDMVKRYAHLSQAHTAALVARVNAKVFGQGAAQ